MGGSDLNVHRTRGAYCRKSKKISLARKCGCRSGNKILDRFLASRCPKSSKTLQHRQPVTVAKGGSATRFWMISGTQRLGIDLAFYSQIGNHICQLCIFSQIFYSELPELCAQVLVVTPPVPWSLSNRLHMLMDLNKNIYFSKSQSRKLFVIFFS